MSRLYAGLVLSFLGLIFVHLVFLVTNLYFWTINGIDFVVQGENFIETIYFSIYLKWIGLADGIWIVMLLVFLIKRKHYKTDPNLHYLKTNKIFEPKICVIIPTFNEEKVIEQVVKDFQSQKNVREIIVIDNHSNDRTIEIAEKFNVKIIKKEKNEGLAHSVITGLIEFLKTDSNIIAIAECDGTFSGDDLSKMIPYLDNSEMVIGTRQVQILTEKNNQNSMFYVWGNYVLAKLIQIKYFSLTNLGIVELTDVGCLYRCIRKDALEKIKEQLDGSDAKKIIENPNSGLIANFLTMIAIENNLRIVEVPITFRNRIGISKTGADKKGKAVIYGLRFFWYILTK